MAEKDILLALRVLSRLNEILLDNYLPPLSSWSFEGSLAFAVGKILERPDCFADRAPSIIENAFPGVRVTNGDTLDEGMEEIDEILERNGIAASNAHIFDVWDLASTRRRENIRDKYLCGSVEGGRVFVFDFRDAEHLMSQHRAMLEGGIRALFGPGVRSRPWWARSEIRSSDLTDASLFRPIIYGGSAPRARAGECGGHGDMATPGVCASELLFIVRPTAPVWLRSLVDTVCDADSVHARRQLFAPEFPARIPAHCSLFSQTLHVPGEDEDQPFSIRVTFPNGAAAHNVLGEYWPWECRRDQINERGSDERSSSHSVTMQSLTSLLILKSALTFSVLAEKNRVHEAFERTAIELLQHSYSEHDARGVMRKFITQSGDWHGNILDSRWRVQPFLLGKTEGGSARILRADFDSLGLESDDLVVDIDGRPVSELTGGHDATPAEILQFEHAAASGYSKYCDVGILRHGRRIVMRVTRVSPEARFDAPFIGLPPLSAYLDSVQGSWYYLNMRALPYSKFDAAWQLGESCPRLIIDARGYIPEALTRALLVANSVKTTIRPQQFEVEARRRDSYGLSKVIGVDSVLSGAPARRPYVLIDRRTLSGGEFCAAALTDMQEAILVGEPTAGACGGVDEIRIGGLRASFTCSFFRFNSVEYDQNRSIVPNLEIEHLTAEELYGSGPITDSCFPDVGLARMLAAIGIKDWKVSNAFFE